MKMAPNAKRFVVSCFFAMMVATYPCQQISADDQIGSPKHGWMRGKGKDLQFRITGKVLFDDGEPASDCVFHARLETRFSVTELPVQARGSLFRFWIPVGATDWFRLHLNGTSADQRQVAKTTLLRYQIRQAAVDGINLILTPAERLVSVTVVDDEKPVAHAQVAATFVGEVVTATTNSRGVATFPCLRHETLSQLTAWTDDYRVGGFAFNRDPPRNPRGEQFTIELNKCRPQVIRFINNENQLPIPDLEFVLIVGTGPPNYQFTGKIPACTMKTDSNGEAVFRWFPDWKKQKSYVEFPDPRWIKPVDEEMIDGVLVVRLVKSQFDARQRVVGQVHSKDLDNAGFNVKISSFQGEEENRSDFRYAFTDQDGRFEADYLPNATYCICVNDERFVSNIIDLVPYDATAQKTTTPTLDVAPGQRVEVVVTSGPDRQPIAYQGLQLETQHSYSWQENGTTRHGRSGRRWWATTNKEGRISTFAQPGKEIVGSLYSPVWRATESVMVKESGVTRLEFHKSIPGKRKLTGRLVLPDGSVADLNEATVEIGSIDGETEDRFKIEADQSGSFTFDSRAAQIGVYARTKDKRFAGVATFNQPDQSLELKLTPTGKFTGQVLGRDDIPIPRHPVRAVLRVSGKTDFSKPFPTSFEAGTFKTSTDELGHYKLTGLPRDTILSLRVGALESTDGELRLNNFKLSMEQADHPPALNRLANPQRGKVSVSDRFQQILRDCRLLNFHAMVILYQPNEKAKTFVDSCLLNYSKTKEVASFLPLIGQVGEAAFDQEMSDFVQSKKWPVPDQGQIFVCVLDADARELGRIDLAVDTATAMELGSQFIRKYSAPEMNAKEKWNQAFVEAKRTNRHVWVSTSQRYCDPCFHMARWFDDHKTDLAADFILLRIDEFRDIGGRTIAQQLTGGQEHRAPFHAIFDANEKKLVDSLGPNGNIGFPSHFQGKRHLREMLINSRRSLTIKQITQFVDSLDD